MIIRVVDDLDPTVATDLRAHRALLAARSSVFEAMLSRDMQERRTNVIEINDLDPPVVQAMLEYMYTGFAKGMRSKVVVNVL